MLDNDILELIRRGDFEIAIYDTIKQMLVDKRIPFTETHKLNVIEHVYIGETDSLSFVDDLGHRHNIPRGYSIQRLMMALRAVILCNCREEPKF